MDLIKRLWREEDGQGLVEYTLVIVIVTLIFWLGVRGTNVGVHLATGWAKVTACVTSPFTCTP